ncbi:MAG: hypothetical protein WBA51_17165 [Erythrobacter sp.]
MKNILLASGLAFAAFSVPTMSVAQDTAGEPNIVVSAEHQRDWDRGNRLEAEGLSDLQKAQRDLVRYSADVVNAQDLRDTSVSRAQNAREAFENLTARPFFSDPAEALKWAKQVEKVAGDWRKYDRDGDTGVNDLERSQNRQARAQEQVDKAQAKIDEGRAMKNDAERASQLPAKAR